MRFDFIPEPTTVQQAAFQARVMGRAETLFADGYIATWGEDMYPGDTHMLPLVSVVGPDMQTYLVNLFTNTCTCECCVKNKFCKHLIACKVEQQVREDARDEARVEEYETVRAMAGVPECLLPNSYPF